MTTPSIFSRAGKRARALTSEIYLTLACLCLVGCEATKDVRAVFHLTANPVLVLIDDDAGRIKSPLAKRYLADEIAQELIGTKSAQQVIPQETVLALRQVHGDFEKRGCREIGELAGAEQVVWVQVQDFFVEEDFSDALAAAYVHATVKVINVLEKESRTRVRLWPTSAAGSSVNASLTGAHVAQLKTQDAISRELARELAVKVARFFHDHTLRGIETRSDSPP